MTTMGEREALERAMELGGVLLTPLVRFIAEEIQNAGKTEAEATRAALRRLADTDELEPILPKIRDLYAARRASDAVHAAGARVTWKDAVGSTLVGHVQKDGGAVLVIAGADSGELYEVPAADVKLA